jgi:hypothetical protein
LSSLFLLPHSYHIAVDPKQRKIYTAISYQRQGMMDFANSDAPSGRYDLGGKFIQSSI